MAKSNKTAKTADRPIPYTVTDPDAPIPYRVRVATPSPELRNFVVPKLGIRGFAARPAPVEAPSAVHRKVA